MLNNGCHIEAPFGRTLFTFERIYSLCDLSPHRYRLLKCSAILTCLCGDQVQLRSCNPCTGLAYPVDRVKHLCDTRSAPFWRALACRSKCASRSPRTRNSRRELRQWLCKGSDDGSYPGTGAGKTLMLTRLACRTSKKMGRQGTTR